MIHVVKHCLKDCNRTLVILYGNIQIGKETQPQNMPKKNPTFDYILKYFKLQRASDYTVDGE